jgi:uncharacterized membrane protein
MCAAPPRPVFGGPDVRPPLIACLLWFAAIGCGLLAGVYFAFSAFIMTALSRIEPMHAVKAMNSINSAILHSWFMTFFYGTTLASMMLLITSLVRKDEPGAMLILAGGLIYVVGMFLCTVFFNVPLNNALAAVDPSAAAAVPVWARYLENWTLWNHVRTISSTAATTLYIAAIVVRR